VFSFAHIKKGRYKPPACCIVRRWSIRAIRFNDPRQHMVANHSRIALTGRMQGQSMKPLFWRMIWHDPKTGLSGQRDYPQRAAARGDSIIYRAQGRVVDLKPIFKD
jgi:hypothetical protein